MAHIEVPVEDVVARLAQRIGELEAQLIMAQATISAYETANQPQPGADGS